MTTFRLETPISGKLFPPLNEPTAEFVSWAKRHNSLPLYQHKTDELVRFLVSYTNGVPFANKTTNICMTGL